MSAAHALSLSFQPGRYQISAFPSRFLSFFVRCFLPCLLVPAFWAFPVAAASGGSPEEAVMDIQKAIDRADLNLFEQRVDVEALAAQGSDMFVSMLAERGSAGLPPVVALLANTARSPDAAFLIRQMLANEAAAFVRDGVASGRFGGRRGDPRQPSRGLLSPLFADVSTARKVLSVAGKARRIDEQDNTGHAVELPVRVRDDGSRKSYGLRLRLERDSTAAEGWKVVRIADLPEIADRIWKEMAN